jgi:hypothetical protein
MATGYIILIVFAVWVFSALGAFIAGYIKGRKAEQNEQREEALRKAESDKAFEVEKEKIREEVYNHAENEKAQLSSGTGRERFDAINNSLRNNKN